jgi:hypothetical protein
MVPEIQIGLRKRFSVPIQVHLKFTDPDPRIRTTFGLHGSVLIFYESGPIREGFEQKLINTCKKINDSFISKKKKIKKN